nr:alpha/beta fold hydrolase [Luteibacter rhizovicinus]
MHSPHRPVVAAVVLASLPAVCGATSIPTPHIAWGACPDSWVGRTSVVLGTRLQCGNLKAPLDHVTPDGRQIDVGVIRVRAGDPAGREGAIFFNPGGPGIHPGKLLRSIGEGWSSMRTDDPDEGDKRRLADRYDLIAVIPRGLVGSGSFRCAVDAPAPPAYAFLPTHLGDANWRLVVESAQATVDACSTPAGARHINTEQHARDMDMVRRVLGDDRLHFYGISYGGMVGAWYASMYPTHTGRLLLDSTMDLMHGYRAAALMALAAQQRAFSEDVVAPVLRDPTRFGLGTSRDTVASAIDDFPARAREAWAGRLDTPVRLAAALKLAEWMASGDPPTLEAMTRFIGRTIFSNDQALDRRLRWEAGQLARTLYSASATDPSTDTEPDGGVVRILMGCNDVSWPRSEAEIRESARRYAARYFNFTGDATMEELTCSRWGGPGARQPNLTVLGSASPFLLIQSEKDTSTPLAGASHVLHAFANARMLLVRNSSLHGVFNFTTSPCIERTASRYLLTGDLPATRSRAFACNEVFDNPVDAMPGGPSQTATEPTPMEGPLVPADHDEF